MKNQKKEGSFYAAKVCMSPGIRLEGCIPCFGRIRFGVKIPESLGILADNLFLCKKNNEAYEINI